MELEIIRMPAAALTNVTWGVNAKLSGVPRDAGDPQPPNVTVYDSTRHGWVTRRQISLESTPATFPALAVSIFKASPISGEIQTVFRDGEFDVLFEYIARSDQEASATAAGLYTMRALMRTLAVFHHNDNAALRTRNGVQLLYCKRLLHQAIHDVREDVVVTAALLATYQVRDTQPVS